jgi:hypothetical protein
MTKRVFLFLLLIFITALYCIKINKQTLDVVGEERFIKLDVDAKALAKFQGPWHCILDKKTGLTWENKTSTETIHDGFWSYSWYLDGKGTQNRGDCYFEQSRCDVSDLIKRTNQENLCQRNNWRLPTVKELNTLINHNALDGRATTYNDYFLQTQPSHYWTAETIKLSGFFAHLGQGAITINFGSAQPDILPFNQAAFVRLVSSH